LRPSLSLWARATQPTLPSEPGASTAPTQAAHRASHTFKNIFALHTRLLRLFQQDNAVVLLLEPLHGVLLPSRTPTPRPSAMTHRCPLPNPIFASVWPDEKRLKGLLIDSASKRPTAQRTRAYLGDAVFDPDPRLAAAPLRHPVPAPLHHHVEVHTVNARVRVVLQPQVDVLINPEAEVARGAAKNTPTAMSVYRAGGQPDRRWHPANQFPPP
jgi:hypothetical protein